MTRTATVVRGISNLSRVSCHLACALQIIIHGLVPLREALILIATANDLPNEKGSANDLALLTSLGSFFRIYLNAPASPPPPTTTTTTTTTTLQVLETREASCDVVSNVPVDPSDLYRVLKTHSAMVDPEQLGDAVTGLRKILHLITVRRSSSSSSSQEPPSLLSTLLDPICHAVLSGTLRQDIVGVQGTKRRIKTKEVALSYPFVIGSASSVEQALAQTLKTSIRGYDWEHSSTNNDYIETTTTTTTTTTFQMEKESSSSNDPNTLSSNDCDETQNEEWVTHKILSFVSLSQCILLHIQRFSRTDPMLRPIHAQMDVPPVLPLPIVMGDNKHDSEEANHPNDNRNEYELHSAILLVMDVSSHNDNDHDDEEEGGHYVSVLKVSQDKWCLVDDDQVSMLGHDEAYSLLSGNSNDESNAYVAVFLLYQRQKRQRQRQQTADDIVDDHDDDDTNFGPLLEQLQEEIMKHEIRYDDSLVGRRLRIRWSKGKFYSGRISSYDVTTRKHTVTYDDGDVKMYTLKQKTIEWD